MELFIWVFLAIWGTLTVVVNIVFWFIEQTVYVLFWITALIKWVFAYVRQKRAATRHDHKTNHDKKRGDNMD
ncbi:MAG: hypothetical protein IIT66_04755 [Acetobacter sp.]|nr:hypothetical protein [Acetobacter sp.]